MTTGSSRNKPLSIRYNEAFKLKVVEDIEKGKLTRYWVSRYCISAVEQHKEAPFCGVPGCVAIS